MSDVVNPNSKPTYEELENQIVELKKQIENFRLNAIIQNEEKDKLEIKLLEEKSKAGESEEKYRLLYESNQMPISVFDTETLKFLSVNNAFVEKYGYTREEFLNMTILDIRPESEIRRVKESVKTNDKGLVNVGVYLHKKKNGEIIQVEIIRHDTVFDGRKAKLVFVNDVTDKIKVENILKERNQFLTKLTNSLESVVFTVDLESRNIEYVNNRVEVVLGYSPNECMGNSTKFLYPDKKAFIDFGKQLQNAIQKNQEFLRIENTLRKKNGELFSADITTSFLNKKKVVTVLTDITDWKNAEQDLIEAKEKAEENYEKLLEAQKISHVGSWEYIVDTDSVIWSKELYNIFERSYELPAPKYSEQAPFYTEESFALLDKAVQDCIRNENSYDLELDIITSNGNIKHIISKGNVKKDANNKIIGCNGTAQDITERKFIEQELVKAKEKAEESNKKISNLLSDLQLSQKIADIGNWQLDPKIGIPIWSEKIFEIYERNPGDGIPHVDDYKNIYEAEQYEIFNKAITAAIKKGDNYDIVLKLKLPSGRIKWVHVLCQPDLSNKSEAGYFLRGTIQDITKYKEAEAELIKAKESAEESEKALKQSGDLMKYIIEHNRSAVAVHDKNFKYIYVSQRYLQEYNLEGKNVIGKHHYDVFPDLPQKWRDVHKKALLGKVSSAEDDPYYKDDGTVVWTRWECRPWYENDNTIGGFIVYTEVITERKKMELELLKAKEQANTSLQQIKIIQANTPNIIWKWDIDKKEDFKNSYISEVADKFVGLPKGSIGNSMTKFFSYILPEYLPLVDDAIKNAVQNPNRLISIEYEVKRADGKLAWFSSSGKVIFENEKLTIYGSTIDITEKKQIETELDGYRKNLEKLVKERTKELEEKNKELEEYNALFVGREFRIKELKDKVKDLEEKLKSN